MVPHHQTKHIKPKTATPLMSTNTKTEPLSLELFNRAAADLDKKGEIEIEHDIRSTYSTARIMDAAFEFSFNSLNMEFAINLAAEGHSVPDLLFM